MGTFVGTRWSRTRLVDAGSLDGATFEVKTIPDSRFVSIEVERPETA